jgi:glutamate carboxypeptidase
MNRPPYQKDAGIAQLFGKAQVLYREIGKELLDVPLTGGGSDGNFTAALGIPALDGLGADGKGAHAAYEQIYFSSLMPRTYLIVQMVQGLLVALGSVLRSAGNWRSPARPYPDPDKLWSSGS